MRNYLRIIFYEILMRSFNIFSVKYRVVVKFKMHHQEERCEDRYLKNGWNTGILFCSIKKACLLWIFYVLDVENSTF